MSQHLTPEEQQLFAAATSKMPWPIRAYLWTLYPALTTRGRLVVGAAAAVIVGCALAIGVDAALTTIR